MTARGVSLAGVGLTRSYKKGTFALDVPSVEVPAGSVLAILGPSGSGKTTLLDLLGLLEKPTAGKILLDGKGVTTRDRDARMQIAAVFQRPYLFKGTVGGNVSYGLVARGVARSTHQAKIAAALERVGLGGYESRSALALSGGEAQRVALARALVVEPRVLLVDEPLASLDPLLKARLTHDFASIIREAGVTVLYVTHDQDEAFVVADRVAIMNGGRIVACGPVEETMSLPADEWTAAFLGVEEPVVGVVGSSSDGLVGVDFGATRIFVTGAAEPGDRISVAVRPEDVVLLDSEAELPSTTARNRIQAEVVSVSPRGATYHVVLDAGGVQLASSVSRASTVELGLVPGSLVLAVFKATAVRWRPVGQSESGPDSAV
jgi:tungstate transport system ATP-binding protein